MIKQIRPYNICIHNIISPESLKQVLFYNILKKKEIKVAKEILKDCNLYNNTPTLIACPTCGRIQYDLIPVANEIEDFLQKKSHSLDFKALPIKVEPYFCFRLSVDNGYISKIKNIKVIAFKDINFIPISFRVSTAFVLKLSS